MASMAAVASALSEGSLSLKTYRNELWPVMMALYEIEGNGIKINADYVKQALTENLPKHELTFFRHMNQSTDGYVRYQFDPVGGKTGRFRVKEGFNCMGIPHGRVRNAIISRYDSGSILTFDYNAMDYRSIIDAIGDKGLTKLYSGADDFHMRTAELAFRGEIDNVKRDIIKQFSYIYIYGGSSETLAEKTGLSMEKISRLTMTMDKWLKPVVEFRENLAVEARKNGFVEMPSGARVPVLDDDAPGKIMGLFAQGYSSYVFRRAIVNVQNYLRQKRSKFIFTVHDEIIIDQHPEESSVSIDVLHIIERAISGKVFRAKMKKGVSYAQCTDE